MCEKRLAITTITRSTQLTRSHTQIGHGDCDAEATLKIWVVKESVSMTTTTCSSWSGCVQQLVSSLGQPTNLFWGTNWSVLFCCQPPDVLWFCFAGNHKSLRSVSQPISFCRAQEIISLEKVIPQPPSWLAVIILSEWIWYGDWKDCSVGVL